MLFQIHVWVCPYLMKGPLKFLLKPKHCPLWPRGEKFFSKIHVYRLSMPYQCPMQMENEALFKIGPVNLKLSVKNP